MQNIMQPSANGGSTSYWLHDLHKVIQQLYIYINLSLRHFKGFTLKGLQSICHSFKGVNFKALLLAVSKLAGDQAKTHNICRLEKGRKATKPSKMGNIWRQKERT